MNPMHSWWSDVKDVLPILTTVAGLFALVFIYRHFSPTVAIRIVSRWSEKAVILRVEFENKSRMRMLKNHVRLQVLEHSTARGEDISEFVPFSRERISAAERPLEWKDPIEILSGLVHLEPGEIVGVERLVVVKSTDTLLHIGVQFMGKPDLPRAIDLLLELSPRRPIFFCWTATSIVAKP